MTGSALERLRMVREREGYRCDRSVNGSQGEMNAMKRIMMCLLIGTFLVPACECWPYTAIVEWAPNSEADLAGYTVYYGTDTRIYSTSADVGMSTSHQISGLVEGVTYYFAVTAYNASGAESLYSEEVSFLEPGAGDGGSGGGSGGTGGGTEGGAGGGTGTSSGGGGGRRRLLHSGAGWEPDPLLRGRGRCSAGCILSCQ